MKQKLVLLPHCRFVIPEENRKKFDLGLEEDENLLKLRQITKKQAFAHQRHQKIDAFERLVFEDFNFLPVNSLLLFRPDPYIYPFYPLTVHLCISFLLVEIQLDS